MKEAELNEMHKAGSWNCSVSETGLHSHLSLSESRQRKSRLSDSYLLYCRVVRDIEMIESMEEEQVVESDCG